MKRGPKPKPTRIRIMQGNPGKRPLNAKEPMPKRGRPTCPKWLASEAKAKWKKLVPELDRLGLLTVVDGDTLSAYCQAWAEFRAATEALEREGRTTVAGTGGMKQHPAVNMQRTAWRAIRDFASLFGLDPSSRSRLSTPGAAEDSDPMEALLRGEQTG